jgi:hypothetical protein
MDPRLIPRLFGSSGADLYIAKIFATVFLFFVCVPFLIVARDRFDKNSISEEKFS